MELNESHVRALAKLSRLSLSEDEIPGYLKDLGSILAYVEKLASAQTDGVEETAHADAGSNVWREDEAVACDPALRRRLIDAFPRREGDLLEVQAVFENRTE